MDYKFILTYYCLTIYLRIYLPFLFFYLFNWVVKRERKKKGSAREGEVEKQKTVLEHIYSVHFSTRGRGPLEMYF